MIVDSHVTNFVKIVRAHHEANVKAYFEVRQYFRPDKPNLVVSTSVYIDGRYELPAWLEIA